MVKDILQDTMNGNSDLEVQLVKLNTYVSVVIMNVDTGSKLRAIISLL